MLKEGQFFVKNGKTYGVLDLLKYNNGDYVFMSIESGKEIDYKFYSIKYDETKKDYNLALVENQDVLFELMHIEEDILKRLDIVDIIPKIDENKE